MMQGGSYSSMSDRFQAQTIKGVASKSAVHTKAMGGSKPSYSDDIDDDGLLENIDVGQIVMDHFQSSSTPQPPISKFPPFTPNTNKENLAALEEKNMPPEQCLNCSHNCELGLYSEALIHLLDMKDTLINISNDLIDNFDEMTSEKIENLRQERQQLNKQIQLL